ncbi:major facilitator superfamily MFS_1 [Pseudoxanthomonas suwonensis 11-1]|uniref:Major facilitator superfamily MFS_1 n=1 Tax=Pseudoxanthomonas suwonensis (strain 11-1) TaxID=743721 RepID=E6WUD7_PSEUU|nr:MFS transporter [Pseudoxanthomonas suwonensis]ADV27921.1 major facilitator superfamily MFS_1 [Pseudoxanthomonas suwonensis 11-1]
MQDRTRVPSTPSLQQHATRAAFFMPGFAIAAWAPLVPFAKARAGLDEAMLGMVLLCLGAGSLLAMPMAGALAARQGCRRVMLAAMLAACAALPVLAIAPNAVVLGLALFVFGAAIGAMDCTMNLQAVVVERESGRALMSGFHAFYSIGGFAGAAAMTALLSAGAVPVWACVAAVVVVLALVGVAFRHWRGERVDSDVPAFAWPRGIVLLVGVVCFVMFLAEGAMLDWGAVFLDQAKDMDPARAGLGYVAFSLAMTVARLTGDGVVQAVGAMRAVVAGALVAFAGFAVIVLAPGVTVALLGFVLVGIGCANIVPVMFTAAGRQTAMPESLAIPAISTLGYAGVLAGPALIGFVAHGTSLQFAFWCLAFSVLGVALATRWLRV